MDYDKIHDRCAVDPVLSKIQDLNENDIMRVLNGSYIAKRFFGKSQSWFSQKMNNLELHGKTYAFTEAEVETLRNALYTLSIELQEIADGLK